MTAFKPKRPSVMPRHLCSLVWARDKADEWKGSLASGDYPEFEVWVDEVDEALERVKLDRKRLRAALEYISLLPEVANVTEAQYHARKRLFKLECKVRKN